MRWSYPSAYAWCQLCGVCLAHGGGDGSYPLLMHCTDCAFRTNQGVEVDESGIKTKQWAFKRS